MMLISRPYSSLGAPVSSPTSTAEIRNAFQQSRPRKRNKRLNHVFEIAEDQENANIPRSSEPSLPHAIAVTAVCQSDVVLWKEDAMLNHAPALRSLKTRRELYPAKPLSTTSPASYGSELLVSMISKSTEGQPTNPGRSARRNAPARTSKRAPLKGLNEDLNAPALMFDRPGANLMKENIPPGWQCSPSKDGKKEKAHTAPSQALLRYGPIYESTSVFEGLPRSAKTSEKIAYGATSTKKAISSYAWRHGNSLKDIAHKSISTCNSFHPTIPPSISSIKAFLPLTASSISLLSYYLATSINSIPSVNTSTKRKAITMEDPVRSTHAKMQARAAREAEETRVPAVTLLKTIIFSGREHVENFPQTYEIERRFQHTQLGDRWLCVLERQYGVRAGSLRKRFLEQPFPAANLIYDYLLVITKRSNFMRPEPRSLEELLLRLGCRANFAASLNKIKKLDVHFIMAVISVLALKAQATEQGR